ncbi:MAG: apolipoprotein N-acyltransferase [Candidatus Cloacimonetes bacterium]|nr:apolipoprotein N-acyltransferase [Candidatus Cloacimonadota bacterium]
MPLIDKNKDLLLVMLSAFLLGLARLPHHLGFLGFVGLIPLLFYFDMKNHSGQRLFMAGFAYASVYCFTALQWLSLVTLGGFVGIISLFTLYYFALFKAINLVWHVYPRLKYLSFTVFWLTLEFLQNFSELRFPWSDIGYSLSDYLALIQAADIGGIYLLSSLLVISNCLIYHGYKTRKKMPFIALISLIFLWFGYGVYRINSIKLVKHDEKIAIMQPSIPQDQKWDFRYLQDNLSRYTELTSEVADTTTSMVIWPESCLPIPILRNNYYHNLIADLASSSKMAIFAGFPDRKIVDVNGVETELYYNAASLIHPDGTVDEPYYKNYLVPFGERMILLKLIPALRKLNFGQANWEYGTEINSYEYNGFRFSPQICFEVAFPEHTHRAYRNQLDYIINITNDAWFYYSAGTYQHAMMNRFRAVESRKQIYRAANTGISIVIDPIGRILKKTALFEITSIVVPLNTTEAVSLYYSYFYYLTYLFPIGAFVMLIASLIRKPRKLSTK